LVNFEKLTELSQEGKHVIKKMLEAKPLDRYSANEILECSWI